MCFMFTRTDNSGHKIFVCNEYFTNIKFNNKYVIHFMFLKVGQLWNSFKFNKSVHAGTSHNYCCIIHKIL